MEKIAKQLVLAGIGIPVVFWATLALCGILLGEYSHFSNLVSELGAAGTQTRVLFCAGLLFCSALSLLFVVGLCLACRKSRISVVPALVVLTFTFSIAGAAIYPMPHRLHGVLGKPSVVLFLSPLLAAILWSKVSSLPGLRLFSVLSFLTMSLGFLAFIPDVLVGYAGLKQRFFHAGWSIWFTYLSVSFSVMYKRERNKQMNTGLGAIGSGPA